MQIGLGISLTGLRRRIDDLSRVLATLFSNDEPGFLLTASPETCFTDLAGTTQAEPGDPVALWLDQSGNDNHATQETVANRPILGRKPKGGRRNALEHTEDFSRSVWDKQGVTVSQVDGEIWEMNEGTGTGLHVISQRVLDDTDPTGTAVDVRAGNASPWVRLTLRNIFFAPRIDFNLGTLEINKSGGDLINPVSDVIPLEDGWYRLFIRHEGVDGGDEQNRFFALAILGADRERDHTGTGRTIQIRRPQREPGNVITDYQRVTDRFDVTEAGKPNRHYLFFGGASDPRWMQTPVITPGTDKVQVFAGVRKLSDDEDVGAVISSIPGSSSIDGSVELSAPRLSGERFGLFSRGTVNLVIVEESNEFDAPISNVLSGVSDISAPFLALRIDGNQVQQSTESQGTGNFSSNAVFLGRRDGSNRFHNGEISALTTRFGPNLTTEQIEKVEKFTASKVAEETIT